MRFSKAFVAIGLILGVFGVHSSAQAPARGPFVAGEILVKFTPGANANARAGAHQAAGGTMLAEVARTRVHRVRVRTGDESAAIARYLQERTSSMPNRTSSADCRRPSLTVRAPS